MASEIRVNKQTNRVGLGTVTYTDTGIIVSGIVTTTGVSGLTQIEVGNNILRRQYETRCKIFVMGLRFRDVGNYNLKIGFTSR